MGLISSTEMSLSFFPLQVSTLVHNICYHGFLEAVNGLFHGILIHIP